MKTISYDIDPGRSTLPPWGPERRALLAATIASVAVVLLGAVATVSSHGHHRAPPTCHGVLRGVEVPSVR